MTVATNRRPGTLKLAGGGFLTSAARSYSNAEHRVWATLCRRRLEVMETQVCRAFSRGLAALAMPFDRIPRLADLSARLRPLTGWSIAPVDGLVEGKPFFEALARRTFTSTLEIRSADRLDYLPEPDIFHDAFGHIPMHTDRHFADFAQAYGALGVAAASPARLTALVRLYWYTFEFGLIREQGRLRLYGAGLVSSLGEGAHALSGKVAVEDFDLDTVIGSPFEIDRYQPRLFAIEGFDQVQQAVATLAARWADDARMPGRCSRLL